MKESEIQSQIIDFLQILEKQGKLFFQRTNNVPISMMRNGKRVFRSMPQGAKKGFPDIIVVVDGYFIGLEVKTLIGRQSEHQKAMEKLIIENGGVYVVVRSLDDVINILKKG